MCHLLYLMFRCDFDVMESLEFLWELNTDMHGGMELSDLIVVPRIREHVTCCLSLICTWPFAGSQTLQHFCFGSHMIWKYAMFCSGTEEEAVAWIVGLDGWQGQQCPLFQRTCKMAASIYPVKKSFGPFVLQELAHYKAARRIMKKKRLHGYLSCYCGTSNLNIQKLKD